MDVIRENSVIAFSMVLTQRKNCEILEKNIYKSFSGSEDTETNYKWCVYQILGMLLVDKKNLQEILKNIKDQKIGWKNPIYDNISDKIQEFDEYLVKPFEVVEGVIQCGKCGSKKTWSVQKQTRSSDEPMTTFSRCVECGNNWTYSG